MERTAVIAGPNFVIGLSRLGQRAFAEHRDERVQSRAIVGDLLQAIRRDRFRSGRSLPDSFAEGDNWQR